jgi:hypothetical protein
MIERPLVDAEMLGCHLHQSDDLILVQALLVHFECRSDESDHHSVGLHVRQADEHSEVAPGNARSLARNRKPAGSGLFAHSSAVRGNELSRGLDPQLAEDGGSLVDGLPLPDGIRLGGYAVARPDQIDELVHPADPLVEIEQVG